ncbi:putative alpha beta [Diaporthe ampelina]|uniref:Putative alpha beta n=1 Tax=Diaporthe ampelina TaxID=1214573 RepID=A0A0G2FI32_9PEZI|nr:putative alpha beta [Diaporthe ampelina]
MPTTDSFALPETFAHNGWSVSYLARRAKYEDSSAAASPWVVFVHGTPWSSDVFRPLANALSAGGSFNVVLYDLPGYGQSQTHSNAQAYSEPDTSVKAQAESLAALLRYLGLDGKDGNASPHVIAHDIAGVISLRAHLLHGCEYRSLCLLDTNCVLPWGDKLYNSVRSNAAVFEELPAGVFEGCLRAIIQSARAKGNGLGQEWEDVLARPWLTGGPAPGSSLQYDPQKNFVRQIKQSDDSHTAELLDNGLYPKVRCDVKVLWGEQDAWIPYEKMQGLAKLLGDRLRGFVTIPEAGHLVMLDQPERVTLEISRWLERQD